MCVTMGPVFITVIGQCMGAGNIPEAEYYFKKLTAITLIASFAWNVLVFAVTTLLMSFYDLADETKSLVVWLVLIHNIANSFAFPLADALCFRSCLVRHSAGELSESLLLCVLTGAFAQ